MRDSSGRSQKGQHTELHRRFRQHQQRCQRHGGAAEKAHQPPERIRRAAAETDGSGFHGRDSRKKNFLPQKYHKFRGFTSMFRLC